MAEQAEQPSEEQDEKLPVEELPIVSVESAQLAYKLMMSSMVTRLYLFLYGESDQEEIVALIEKVNERRTVVNRIIVDKTPPLRAIYEFLVEIEAIEAIDLPPEAWEFLDRPDTLQSRIETEPSADTDNASMLRKIELNCNYHTTGAHISPYTILWNESSQRCPAHERPRASVLTSECRTVLGQSQLPSENTPYYDPEKMKG